MPPKGAPTGTRPSSRPRTRASRRAPHNSDSGVVGPEPLSPVPPLPPPPHVSPPSQKVKSHTPALPSSTSGESERLDTATAPQHQPRIFGPGTRAEGTRTQSPQQSRVPFMPNNPFVVFGASRFNAPEAVAPSRHFSSSTMQTSRIPTEGRPARKRFSWMPDSSMTSDSAASRSPSPDSSASSKGSDKAPCLKLTGFFLDTKSHFPDQLPVLFDAQYRFKESLEHPPRCACPRCRPARRRRKSSPPEVPLLDGNSGRRTRRERRREDKRAGGRKGRRGEKMVEPRFLEIESDEDDDYSEDMGETPVRPILADIQLPERPSEAIGTLPVVSGYTGEGDEKQKGKRPNGFGEEEHQGEGVPRKRRREHKKS